MYSTAVRVGAADASSPQLEAHQRNVKLCTSIIAPIAFWPKGFHEPMKHQSSSLAVYDNSVLQGAYQHLGLLHLMLES